MDAINQNQTEEKHSQDRLKTITKRQTNLTSSKSCLAICVEDAQVNSYNIYPGKCTDCRHLNSWDWSQPACQLGGADYSSLETVNVKMIQTGSSDVR